MILSAAGDGTARLWDWLSGQSVVEFTNVHRRAIRCAAFSADGRSLVTGSEDGTAQVWEVETGRPIGPAMDHGNWLYDVAFTTTNDHVRIWEAVTARALTEPIALTHPLHEIKVNRDASRLLVLARSFSSTNQVDLLAQDWDVSRARPRALGPAFAIGQPTNSCLSQDGLYFAAFAGKTGIVWSTTSGQPLRSIQSDHGIRAPTFDPSGSYLAFRAGKNAELWEPTGSNPPRLLKHDTDIEHLGPLGCGTPKAVCLLPLP